MYICIYISFFLAACSDLYTKPADLLPFNLPNANFCNFR